MSARRGIRRLLLGPPAITSLGCLFALLAYLPGFEAPFFTDDHVYLVENSLLRGVPLAKPWAFFVERTNPFEFLPLRDLSYRLDWALFGANPTGYRIHNLILYALCCAAVWCFVRALCREGWRERACARPLQSAWIATFATLLFAVHPAHVESVLWVSGRKDLLSGLFGIVALRCFLAGVARGRAHLVGISSSALLFLAATLSKATALPIAPVAFLLAYGASLDEKPASRRLLRALVLSSPMLVVGVLALALHLFVGADTKILSTASAVRPSAGGALSLPLLVLGVLVRVALFPLKLRLIYDFQEPGMWRALSYMLALATILGGAWSLGVLARRRSLMALGGACFVLFCLPFVQLLPFSTWSLMGERFLFMPLLGLSVLFAAFALARDGRAGPIVGAVVIGLLLVATSLRSFDWRSMQVLLEKNVSTAPRNNNAVSLYVEELIGQRRYGEAQRVILPLREQPVREALAGYVRANEALARGDLASARKAIGQILSTAGWEKEKFRSKLAMLALDAGAPDVAAKLFAEVVENSPHRVNYRYNLGLALKRMGRLEEAAVRMEEAIARGFRDGEVWNQLGLLQKNLGRIGEAEQTFLSGIRQAPRHWHAAYNLSRIYLQQERGDEARTVLLEARRRALAEGDDPRPIDELLESLGGADSSGR
jgi:tetratricopeptide (TPR) repeat protein